MAGQFATDLDGSSDYYTRGSDLTGNADGKEGIFSAWVRFDGNDGVASAFLLSAGSKVYLHKNSSNNIRIFFRNAANATVLDLITTATYTASSTWIHILSSWDLANDKGLLYINDVYDGRPPDTLIDDTIDYTLASWGIGASSAGGNKHHGPMAEIYFAPGQYLDFSVESNRRKFISAAGKPVPLGVAGELPTTNQPIIYFPDGDATVNKGSGGVFVKQGAPVRIAGPGALARKRAALIAMAAGDL